MSRRSRGVCISAIFLITNIAPIAWASSSSADSSNAPSLPAPNSSSQFLPFDANSLMNAKPIDTNFTLDSSGASDFSTLDLAPWPTNSVTPLAPISAPTENDKPAAQHEDLVVPFPALGAGWILLMGA